MNAAEITDKLGLHSLRQRHWWVPAPPPPPPPTHTHATIPSSPLLRAHCYSPLSSQVHPEHLRYVWRGPLRGLGLAVQQHCHSLIRPPSSSGGATAAKAAIGFRQAAGSPKPSSSINLRLLCVSSAFDLIHGLGDSRWQWRSKQWRFERARHFHMSDAMHIHTLTHKVFLEFSQRLWGSLRQPPGASDFPLFFLWVRR